MRIKKINDVILTEDAKEESEDKKNNQPMVDDKDGKVKQASEKISKKLADPSKEDAEQQELAKREYDAIKNNDGDYDYDAKFDLSIEDEVYHSLKDGTLNIKTDLFQALNYTYNQNRLAYQDAAEARKKFKECAKQIESIKAEIKQLSQGTPEYEDARSRLTKVTSERKKWASLKQFNPINLFVAGDPGAAKSSIINQWRETYGIPVLTMTGASLTRAIVQGYPIADDAEFTMPNGEVRKGKKQVYLPSTVFKDLDRPDGHEGEATVLFIDEITRADIEAESALLALISDHWVSNLYFDNGKQELDKFLFTVVACNPVDKLNLDDLTEFEVRSHAPSQAMMDRFVRYNAKSDPVAWKKYFDSVINNQIETDEMRYNELQQSSNNERDLFFAKWKLDGDRNKKAIVERLIQSGKFEFYDSISEKSDKAHGTLTDNWGFPANTLNSRTLTMALNACDGTIGNEDEDKIERYKGKVQYPSSSFLGIFPTVCGPKSFKLVEDVLTGELPDEIMRRMQENSWANLFANTLEGVKAKFR